MQLQWNDPQVITERLIWDAVDTQASAIHLSPNQDHYEVIYRTPAGLQTLETIPHQAFTILDDHWRSMSRSVRREGKRLMYVERAHESTPERLQVRYQKLDTFTGERLTLRLVHERSIATSIDRITERPEHADGGQFFSDPVIHHQGLDHPTVMESKEMVEPPVERVVDLMRSHMPFPDDGALVARLPEHLGDILLFQRQAGNRVFRIDGGIGGKPNRP